MSARFPDPTAAALTDEAVRRVHIAHDVVGYLTFRVSDDAHPIAYVQPAGTISEEFVGVRLAPSITAKLSPAQARELFDSLGVVLMAREIRAEMDGAA